MERRATKRNADIHSDEYTYGTADNATDANIMSRAPFVFTSSFWKRISAITFLRNRRKSVSINGDCPTIAVYISDLRFSYLEILETGENIPITTLAISQAISPNRGSVMYLRRRRSIGSSNTSSRPASAIRRPSR